MSIGVKLISTFVHNTRIETRIEETSESLVVNKSISRTPSTSPHEMRGSYRLLPNAGKQDRNDFKGLTSPARKKRRTGKKSSTTINKPSEKPANSEVAVTPEAEKHDDRIAATDDPCGVNKQRIEGREPFLSKLYMSVSELSDQ